MTNEKTSGSQVPEIAPIITPKNNVQLSIPTYPRSQSRKFFVPPVVSNATISASEVTVSSVSSSTSEAQMLSPKIQDPTGNKSSTTLQVPNYVETSPLQSPSRIQANGLVTADSNFLVTSSSLASSNVSSTSTNLVKSEIQQSLGETSDKIGSDKQVLIDSMRLNNLIQPKISPTKNEAFSSSVEDSKPSVQITLLSNRQGISTKVIDCGDQLSTKAGESGGTDGDSLECTEVLPKSDENSPVEKKECKPPATIRITNVDESTVKVALTDCNMVGMMRARDVKLGTKETVTPSRVIKISKSSFISSATKSPPVFMPKVEVPAVKLEPMNLNVEKFTTKKSNIPSTSKIVESSMSFQTNRTNSDMIEVEVEQIDTPTEKKKPQPVETDCEIIDLSEDQPDPLLIPTSDQPSGNERKATNKSRCPWIDRKQNFSWVKYLEFCQKADSRVKAAPLKVWPEPFPSAKNLFQPGMKLEGIDPQHQYLFCVLTVVDVIGYRLQLHFDGYSHAFDFWTDADSPDLYPVGWCEKNGKQLTPPPGTTRFRWKGYLEHCNAIPAPKQSFIHSRKQMSHTLTNNITPGMKLEAEDRKNQLVCVATVKDIICSRLLIHYDGWDDAYDFWSEITSPYLHPVLWCFMNNKALCPPKDYPVEFNWHDYLLECNASAVPKNCFKTRHQREFKKHMKVEAVDKRNPMLVRVATITDVKPYQIKIHFDGWNDLYDYWVDDDSTEVHPPSWCIKTGHPLQIPLTHEQIAEDLQRAEGCGVAGCKGYGHVRGSMFTTHQTIFGCPYAPLHAIKEPDNLIPERPLVPERRKKFSTRSSLVDLGLGPNEDEDSLKKRVRKRRRFFDEICAPDGASKAKVQKLSSDATANEGSNEGTKTNSKDGEKEPHLTLDAQIHQSMFDSSYNYVPPENPVRKWRNLKHLYTPISEISREKVVSWTPDEVDEELQKLPGCSDLPVKFSSEFIDGESLLLLTQEDLTKLLNFKLGHALKIMAFINSFR